MAKMLFGPQENFSLHYHEWPLGNFGNEVERRCRIQVIYVYNNTFMMFIYSQWS